MGCASAGGVHEVDASLQRPHITRPPNDTAQQWATCVPQPVDVEWGAGGIELPIEWTQGQPLRPGQLRSPEKIAEAKETIGMRSPKSASAAPKHGWASQGFLGWALRRGPYAAPPGRGAGAAASLAALQDPPIAWCCKPSVGTWLSPHPPPLCCGVESKECGRTEPGCVQPSPWHLRPSVGTWLSHAPEQGLS